MIYLLDTNILLRFVDRSHTLYASIRSAIRKLRLDGHELKITSQNCIEFWNVATRPIGKNGFGLVAAMNVNSISHILTLNTKDFSRYASEGIIAVTPRVDEATKT
ncbi:hypothetical protein TUMEXPCC7403_11955 [Tumidithrix helvetica PCC 7403]|uniref:hypothetical protein n=1 Tax=Tumidithrix helvetica TaxID=3457545 RepID=UPI003C957C55